MSLESPMAREHLSREYYEAMAEASKNADAKSEANRLDIIAAHLLPAVIMYTVGQSAQTHTRLAARLAKLLAAAVDEVSL